MLLNSSKHTRFFRFLCSSLSTDNRVAKYFLREESLYFWIHTMIFLLFYIEHYTQQHTVIWQLNVYFLKSNISRFLGIFSTRYLLGRTHVQHNISFTFLIYLQMKEICIFERCLFKQTVTMCFTCQNSCKTFSALLCCWHWFGTTSYVSLLSFPSRPVHHVMRS